MATVLFAWELGGGLGHLLQSRPLVDRLSENGHQVWLALQDLGRAPTVFRRSSVRLLPAPYKQLGVHPVRRPLSFAHVLAAIGFGDDLELFGLGSAWRNLFRLVRPDLIVFDHSPTALLVSRTITTRRIVIGSGFCCPPNTNPWPLFRPEAVAEGDLLRLRSDEARVMERVNRLMGAWGGAGITYLSELYSQVDTTFLTTFPEIDQYVRSEPARYWGPVINRAGEAPSWPIGHGKRVFAYLKLFDNLPMVLQMLGERGCPTIVFIEGADASLHQQLPPSIRLARGRLDMMRVARECDLGILHAGQGAAAAMLLAGKPMLQIPLVLEQQLTAEAVQRMGAGEIAKSREIDDMRAKLDSMLSTSDYEQSAKTFAKMHLDFDPTSQELGMLDQVERILALPAGLARGASTAIGNLSAIPASE